jgi:hypothetical protein
MLPTLTYRTADSTRWGGGNGSDLTATMVDLNFWNLSQAVLALEEAQTTTASIDFISQPGNGNQFFITLTNHQVLGPFIIPTSQWNPRGQWQPNTAYAPFDVVSFDDALYLVMQAVTSAATFSTGTIFNGSAVYVLILQPPADTLPTVGVVGQKLVFIGGSPQFASWENEYVRMALFIPGQPTAGQLLLQYVVVDAMSLPVGLAGSAAFAATQTSTTVSYPIFQNGNAIGSIIFLGPSPDSIEIEFTTEVNFVPGDVITMNAPSAPDANQANISITLLATLTT